MNPYLALYIERASHLPSPPSKLVITASVLHAMRPLKRLKDFFRPHERYGDVRLSVQAHEMAYCTPRVSGLPLDKYSAVEIAIIRGSDEFVRPSKIGIPGFDHLFESSGTRPVAAYVPQGTVDNLRMCLMIRAAQLKAAKAKKSKPTLKPKLKRQLQRLQGPRSRTDGYSGRKPR